MYSCAVFRGDSDKWESDLAEGEGSGLLLCSRSLRQGAEGERS